MLISAQCSWTSEQRALGAALIAWSDRLAGRMRRRDSPLSAVEWIGRGMWHREIVEGLYAQ
jgi:hypothetical protein